MGNFRIIDGFDDNRGVRMVMVSELERGLMMRRGKSRVFGFVCNKCGGRSFLLKNKIKTVCPKCFDGPNGIIPDGIIIGEACAFKLSIWRRILRRVARIFGVGIKIIHIRR